MHSRCPANSPPGSGAGTTHITARQRIWSGSAAGSGSVGVRRPTDGVSHQGGLCRSAWRPPRRHSTTTHSPVRRSSLWAVGGDGDRRPLSDDGPNDRGGRLRLLGVAVAAAAGVALTLTLQGDLIQDALYGDGLSADSWAGVGVGDAVGAALWSAAYWFCSPFQLLLLFLGRIETERPSDWVARQLGNAAGLRIDDVSQSAPAPVWALTAVITAAGGIATAWLLDSSLGDATWSVSTGLGACMAAGVYEVGRPRRVTAEEAADIDTRWRDFVSFAEARLQRNGRCHETEVFAAFRRDVARYRAPEAVSDEQLRSFVRNWAAGATRSSTGFLKGVSVAARVDPFSGQLVGSTSAVQAAAARDGDGDAKAPDTTLT